MATYKAVMRPALEYASSIWSPLASSTLMRCNEHEQTTSHAERSIENCHWVHSPWSVCEVVVVPYVVRARLLR